MKLWIMIFSAALFAGGTCLGVALRPRLADRSGSREHLRPYSDSRELSVDRFASRLGLSDEQDHDLDMILDETHNELEALNRAVRSANDRSRERVMKLLSDEQKKKLESLMAEERRQRTESEVERGVRAYTRFLGLAEPEAQSLRKALLDGRDRKRVYYQQPNRTHDREKAHQELKVLKDKQIAEIGKALSPEHFQRYMEVQELVDR